ncbi:MAG: hypothetical protein HYS19_06470 [Nitrosomonadales bacterium]|nr:hypothetical protein [Nitrosomonadales bacterium]
MARNIRRAGLAAAPRDPEKHLPFVKPEQAGIVDMISNPCNLHIRIFYPV